MPKRVCIIPRPGNIGGPSSFIRKLSVGLERRGVGVTYSFAERPYDAVLVVNATRELGALWRCKREGIPIIQRLGVPNCLHKMMLPGWNPRQYLVGEIQNLMMRVIRSKLADWLVYQSNYVQSCWEKNVGVVNKPAKVIYNGVDLQMFCPDGPSFKLPAEVCLISVEGTQGVDMFNIAVNLAHGLVRSGKTVELLMLGNMLTSFIPQYSADCHVNCIGVVPNSGLPYYYRGADVYVFTDILTGGCPNSLIEALASGTPVVGYDAGVLPEMLNGFAGRFVAYGGNPWKREPPAYPDSLVTATFDILGNIENYRRGARALAEERYDVNKMVDVYHNIMLR